MDKPEVERGPFWITAYRKAEEVLKIEPAALTRPWMEALPSRFGYRCLPMLIANQAGWFLLNNRAFEAVWKGKSNQDSLRVRYDRSNGQPFASSHFGHGILTFRLPYIFRTSPGFDLWVRGPANMPKDGISALEGIVETSWAVASFTMNWKFTRPQRVRFEVNEPIAMLVPIRSDQFELFDPQSESVDDDSKLKESFLAWRTSRAEFVEQLRGADPGFEGPLWQKHYFLGTSPDGTQASAHRHKLRLKDFKVKP